MSCVVMLKGEITRWLFLLSLLTGEWQPLTGYTAGDALYHTTPIYGTCVSIGKSILSVYSNRWITVNIVCYRHSLSGPENRTILFCGQQLMPW